VALGGWLILTHYVAKTRSVYQSMVCLDNELSGSSILAAIHMALLSLAWGVGNAGSTDNCVYLNILVSAVAIACPRFRFPFQRPEGA
jgi:hypothetical protein